MCVYMCVRLYMCVRVCTDVCVVFLYSEQVFNLHNLLYQRSLLDVLFIFTILYIYIIIMFLYKISFKGHGEAIQCTPQAVKMQYLMWLETT